MTLATSHIRDGRIALLQAEATGQGCELVFREGRVCLSSSLPVSSLFPSLACLKSLLFSISSLKPISFHP